MIVGRRHQGFPGAGDVFASSRGPFFVGHVTKDEHHAEERSRAVQNGRRGVVDGNIDPVAPQEDGVVGEPHDRPPLENFLHGAGHRLPGFLVDDPKNLGQRTTARFIERPSRQCFGDGVHERHLTAGIGGDDGVADAPQRRAQ